LTKRSGVLPDPELTEYAYALAKAERYREALDVLDTLENPNTPRALNYRGYATRKLGRTDEGIRYYLKSVALDPTYPQVREYLGEAYVIQGKFDLAKEQLATIERLCGSKDCEYFRDLAEALEKAHAL
jgi:Flp pilus assembly protein TadD